MLTMKKAARGPFDIEGSEATTRLSSCAAVSAAAGLAKAIVTRRVETSRRGGSVSPAQRS